MPKANQTPRPSTPRPLPDNPLVGLLLASASPRRHRLLTEWGIAHRVLPSRIPEPPPGRTPPIRYARRLALAKAQTIARRYPHTWVLGADTIVVVGRHILGKPRDPAQAEGMLRRLSGSRHRVITGVALVATRPEPHRRTRVWVRHAVTWVAMRRLTDDEIRRFARRHRDKAGSYAIQAQETIVTKIEGSRTNVVGLPKELVLPLLRRVGFIPPSPAGS